MTGGLPRGRPQRDWASRVERPSLVPVPPFSTHPRMVLHVWGTEEGGEPDSRREAGAERRAWGTTPNGRFQPCSPPGDLHSSAVHPREGADSRRGPRHPALPCPGSQGYVVLRASRRISRRCPADLDEDGDPSLCDLSPIDCFRKERVYGANLPLCFFNSSLEFIGPFSQCPFGPDPAPRILFFSFLACATNLCLPFRRRSPAGRLVLLHLQR